MKFNTLILMLPLMLTLQGCSSALIKTKEVAVLPPDSLLNSPCSPVNVHSTPRELGDSHIKNYKCIEKYETSLQSLRDWKKEKDKLYNTKAENK